MVEQTRTDQMTKIEALMQQMSQLDAQISLFRSQKVEFDSRYQLAMADGDMLSRELSRARAVSNSFPRNKSSEFRRWNQNALLAQASKPKCIIWKASNTCPN
jgi:hypothetical protein